MGRQLIRTVYALLGALLCNAAAADGQPVPLWQVDGRSNTVYLLGSIHLLRPQDYPLPEIIEAAYQDAEVVVMEVDMDDIDPMAAVTILAAEGMLEDGRSLRDVMGEAAWSRAQTAAEKIDIPLHLLNQVEPWYAAITIEVMALSRLGFDANLGIETYITNKSTADNKPISGFETLAEQIEFLDGLSLTAQREMLLATLEDSAELGSEMNRLIDAWRRGDTAYFEAELLDEFAQYEELHQAILVDRNNRWMTRVVDMLEDDDDYLVVVGALHLIGDDGLPAQLRRRGAAIRQLSTAATLR